jgi:hypothetical protein
MKNLSGEWEFFPRRGKLTPEEARYWRQTLERTLKAGIELEYNLPDKNGTCNQDNTMCACVAEFTPATRMPGTAKCFEQCSNWDRSLDAKGLPLYPDDGNCQIAKDHGCAGIFCSAFKSPCPSCSKYDRGCNKCSELYDIRKDPNNVRALISNELKPTRFVGEHGASGVYDVMKDGSLLGDGGVEVVTVGRRPQFGPLREQLKKIMDTCTRYGAFSNERCSVHVHMLSAYLDGNPHLNSQSKESDRTNDMVRGHITEFEKPMPEIILANFHQLVRRYHCALIWMGISGNTLEHLTRWEKFRKPVMDFSAGRQRMHLVAEDVRNASKSKSKYAMMNYEPTKFDPQTGNITRLHFEARYLDGMLSPSVVAAHVILLYAMVLKAVEMSRHGILESGSEAYMKQQREILKNLCNNDGDYGGHRLSDTKNLGPYMQTLKDQSMQLIRLVKNVLVEQAPADRVLKELANRPVALRLVDGHNWAQIEADLGPVATKSSPLSQHISKLIDTSAIFECINGEEWVEATTQSLAGMKNSYEPEDLRSIKQEVEAFITDNINNGRLYWSKELGGYAMKG